MAVQLNAALENWHLTFFILTLLHTIYKCVMKYIFEC